VMLKFIFVETINAVIQRHLVCDEEFTLVKVFFVTAKSSNVTIVDDIITSKINVFRSSNAIDAKNQNIKKEFIKCSSSEQNAQFMKNLMKFETRIVAYVNRRRRDRDRRESTTCHFISSSRRRSDSLSCSALNLLKCISYSAV
jgi:hypothetical protein